MGTELIPQFSYGPSPMPLNRLSLSPPTFAKPTAGRPARLASLHKSPTSLTSSEALSESQTIHPLALQKALQRLLGPHRADVAEAPEILVKADRHGALCRRLRRQRTISEVHR